MTQTYAHSRADPSPRYRYLAEQYRRLHSEGTPELGLASHATFSGHSLFHYVWRIRKLVAASAASTVLDYGSGKGQQYDPLDSRSRAQLEGAETVLDYWGVDEVRCYDPFYPPYSRLPEGQFDGVICTDVLEHCPEEDIGWILEEIFSFSRKFVFAAVACYPARKLLPDGTNAHCTLRSPEWWRERFSALGARNPGVRLQIAMVTQESNLVKPLLVDLSAP